MGGRETKQALIQREKGKESLEMCQKVMGCLKIKEKQIIDQKEEKPNTTCREKGKRGHQKVELGIECTGICK